MNAVLPIPTAWTDRSTAGIKTGTWRAALPLHRSAPSPCHLACPVGGEIARWIGQARAGDFRAAWETLTLHNPFPAVAGRICHHPCESACNRAGYDEALSICKLERHVGDLALEQGWSFPAAPMGRGERVAVVGAGPSGLSAAYQLRRRGLAVTLIESSPEPGGLMRHGIPAYRLPRAVLDGEIARILALGVELHCGELLLTPQALAALRKQYGAVYLAYGAGRPRRLAQLDYGRPGIFDGSDYLARSAAGRAPALGRRVVVIGGGSAALDVARSARRAGHDVTILALESESALPAQRDEVVEALEEGIALVASAMLGGVTETGAGLRLDCRRVQFKPGARRGEFSVTLLEGEDFRLEADAVVSAIGQNPDLAPLPALLGGGGPLLRTDGRGATALDGLWAGGDLTSMARFVTEAIGMGARAAAAIDRSFGARGDEDADEPAVGLAAINLFEHPRRARAEARRLAPAERLQCDAEVQLGLDATQVQLEAARCFSCGSCTHCDNCITYCPDLALERAGSGYTVLTDYCKGCGVCVRECPSGSMTMIEERR